MLTIRLHYPPTHFHRFRSMMSDPQPRCEHFLFLETWYRYDLTWLQQLRKPATKKFINVLLLLHYPTLSIRFVNQEILFLKCVSMKLTLFDSTSGRFYILYILSVTSTTKNVIACTLQIQEQDTWQYWSVNSKTVVETNSHLYMYFFLLFLLLTCALNCSVDYTPPHHF